MRKLLGAASAAALLFVLSAPAPSLAQTTGTYTSPNGVQHQSQGVEIIGTDVNGNRCIVGVDAGCGSFGGGGGGGGEMTAKAGDIADGASVSLGSTSQAILANCPYDGTQAASLICEIAQLINTIKNGAIPLGSTSGGWNKKALVALTNSPVSVKASAGQVGMLDCYNPNSSQIYIQLFDNASPTVGTTASVPIPISPALTGGFSQPLVGVQFTNAIEVAATTTASGSTAPATPADCTIFFN